MPGSSKYYTFPVRTTLLYPSDPPDAITAAKTRRKWLVEIGRLVAVLAPADRRRVDQRTSATIVDVTPTPVLRKRATKKAGQAMSLARIFLSARENAQRCAVDCAPYVHAKLQAVHHEHGPTGRYIIADRPMTEAEWIAARADVIDVTPEKNDQQFLRVP
jgi:hypothetical protein